LPLSIATENIFMRDFHGMKRIMAGHQKLGGLEYADEDAIFFSKLQH
jgi:hypothetical protein